MSKREKEGERAKLEKNLEEKEDSEIRPSVANATREGAKASFRSMNHAHAKRVCSIINAHLIRRSSSAVKIFTKVRTTTSLTEQNRTGNLFMRRSNGRPIRFAIQPDFRRRRPLCPFSGAAPRCPDAVTLNTDSD